MKLIKGNCLEELKKLESKSVDFVYLDLPYGQTACAWDKKIDLQKLWIELKRIAKNDRTPFFFSCTTKFGFDLIEANKSWFRWDLVWKKNRAAGFLNAYRLPMRKHEMIYCFAKKSPPYDVSSHKFHYENNPRPRKTEIYGMNEDKKIKAKIFENPLPTSIIPPTEEHELVYCFAKKTPEYDVSSHLTGKEIDKKNDTKWLLETGGSRNSFKKEIVKGKEVKEPLPTSIIPPVEEHELVYCFAKKCPAYDVSSHSEYIEDKRGDNKNMVGDNITTYGKQGKQRVNSKIHKDPLPTSIIPPTEEHELVYCFAKKSPEYDVSSHLTGNNIDKVVGDRPSNDIYGKMVKEYTIKEVKEPLPTSIIPPADEPSSWCEFNLDSKTGHRTAKPIKLMEFLLKYWTKVGDTVLDPTMGSGSMGIACDNMDRKFIGMEMDNDIYELAKKRIADNKKS